MLKVDNEVQIDTSSRRTKERRKRKKRRYVM